MNKTIKFHFLLMTGQLSYLGKDDHGRKFYVQSGEYIFWIDKEPYHYVPTDITGDMIHEFKEGDQYIDLVSKEVKNDYG